MSWSEALWWLPSAAVIAMTALGCAAVALRGDESRRKYWLAVLVFGDQLTLPDPYLFVMIGWAEKMLGGLDRWSNLKAFRERMLQRDSVRNVLRFEGLLEAQPAG